MADKTINELSAIDALAAGDKLAVWDVSGTPTTKAATAAQVKTWATDVDINGLAAASGGPATADSVAIYDATASANRKATISDILALVGTTMNITGLTSGTADSSDELPMYDIGAAANRKTTVLGLTSGGLKAIYEGGSFDTPTSTDCLAMVDVSASGAIRSITIADLLSGLMQSGTFTPTVTFGGGSTGITYATQTGIYRRIGSLVFVSLTVVLSAKGSSTGTALLNGLPFTSLTGAPDVMLTTRFFNGTIAGKMDGYVTANGTTIALRIDDLDGTVTVPTDTHFANNTALVCSGCYVV